MVALSPKMYIGSDIITKEMTEMVKDFLDGTNCFDIESAAEEETNQKLSCKGCSKKSNHYTVLSFLDVLRTQRSLQATNRGFLTRKFNTYYTTMKKRGPSYMYWKRIVNDDGYTTRMLPEID